MDSVIVTLGVPGCQQWICSLKSKWTRLRILKARQGCIYCIVKVKVIKTSYSSFPKSQKSDLIIELSTANS